jgi:tRNA-2-methylthio-N6-dimethylallyladenosine synthase
MCEMAYYYIWTVGCQMNKAYSDQLSTDLQRLGYIPARALEEADIVVVNSCVVRQSAENRVLGKLDALRPLKRRNPNALIALAGCMVDPEDSGIGRRLPHVDLFLRPGESAELLHVARARAPEPAGGMVAGVTSPTAYVTIIEGCDNFCSYCVVPYRRGRERSRPMDEIHGQIEALVARGVKEVTLLGQNVDSYGHDLPGAPDLASLLHGLDSIRGLERIRFLTSHPKDMSLDLIRAVSSLDKVCEYISLPVQAGDDRILQRMGRGYNSRDYRDLVSRIRSILPGISLSTDVIVGFPGESHEQFLRTVDLLSEIRFDTVHVAAYSPRPGTLASKEYEDDVPAAEKRSRLRQVEDLEQQVASEINRQLLGRKLEVLVEGSKNGRWWGRTRTGKLVFFDDSSDRFGDLVDIAIERTSPWSLGGSPSK